MRKIEVKGEEDFPTSVLTVADLETSWAGLKLERRFFDKLSTSNSG